MTTSYELLLGISIYIFADYCAKANYNYRVFCFVIHIPKLF